MNTETVAKAMAGAMKATLKRVEEVRPEDLAGYDLVGIRSGIKSIQLSEKFFHSALHSIS